MPIAFRSGSSGGNSGVSVSSYSLDYPANLEASDVVIVTVSGEDDAVANPTVSVSGLTSIGSYSQSGLRKHVFKGTGFSGVGSWTVTLSDAAYTSAVASAWSGAGTDIVLGTAFTGSADGSGDFTIPGVTSVETGELVLLFTQQWSSSYPSIDTPTMTNRVRGGVTSHLSTSDPTIGETGSIVGSAAAWNNVVAIALSVPEGEEVPQVPGEIEDLVAEETDSGQVTLNWSAPDPGTEPITDYEVQYRTSSKGVFKVSGTKILDPNGDVFYPFGVNTGIHYTNFPYPFCFVGVTDGPGAINSLESDPTTYPSNVNAARSWGWNFLRTNVIAYNTDLAPTAAGTVDLIAHGVDELLNAGFVVLMDGRTNDPGDSLTTLGSDNDLRARAFVTRCLELWGDNPLFWVNPFNEPMGGETTLEIASMIELYTDWITFLRGLDYHNPIVFDLPRYGQGINRVADGTFDDFMELDDNLILSWHHYGYPTEFAATDKTDMETLASTVHAKNYCVIMGELGYQWDGNSPNNYTANLLATEWAVEDGRAQALDIGLVAWHAGHDEFNFTSDRNPFFMSGNDGTGLNSYGDLMWDKGQELYANRASATKYDGHVVVPPGEWVTHMDGVSTATNVVIEDL